MNKSLNKSKAETLTYIKKKISQVNIPSTYYFKVLDYKNNRKKFISLIQKRFKSLIAIRSSNKFEDSTKSSNAGKFVSVLNIDSQNVYELEKNIEKVIKSYRNFFHPENQVLIQEMVNNVKISGVCTTCDLENYYPSYQINYFIGKDTSAVTSGKPNTQKITFLDNNLYLIPDKKFRKLIYIVRQIKTKIYNKHIDVEFAINKKNKIIILQVRPLIQYKTSKISHDTAKFAMTSLGKKISRLNKKNYNLLRKESFYSVMSDWNPAEMIGLKPKPLALSLYKELITNKVWAQSRFEYGYKDLRSHQLMNTFLGTPYIDLRVDFNSWIPKDLPHNISKKLVNYYLKIFKNNKEFHDKIEFKIIFSCYTLDTKKKIKVLLKHGFTKKELAVIISSLKKITRITFGKLSSEINLINKLIDRQKKIKKFGDDYIAKIYWLIEDCKKFGTLPFSGLARCGFVSVEILDSLLNKKIITLRDKENFMKSIETITSQIQKDYSKEKKVFLSKYGHLRPNTYEINSLNYKDGYDIYFKKQSHKNKIIRNKKYSFKFSTNQVKKIKSFLKNEKFNFTFDQFEYFLKKSIQLREYSKFIFTKNIDLLFNNLKLFAKKFGLKETDLTYLKISKILDMNYNYTTFKNIPDLKKDILNNKIEYDYNNLLKMPEVLLGKKDLFFNKEKSNSNFIGTSTAFGKTMYLNKFKPNINYNRIVCINNADPGFDFIFTKKISGLITKFGGVNSHMAIRCAELGIPAVIGVGENLFNQIIKSPLATIDCQRKNIILNGKYI